MSLTNIELARRGYEAFSRGDMEAVLGLIDPDFEVHSGLDTPDPSVYRTHEGFLTNIAEWSEVFDDLRYEPEEFVEAGDKLLVYVRVSGRGKESGAAFEQRQVHVWTVRGTKAVRLEFYSDAAEAERAAGLRAA